jgi:hypothetical protein
MINYRKILKKEVCQITILAVQKILTSFYYPDNQRSSLNIFHNFISWFITTQFFTPEVPPDIEKIFFLVFCSRSLQFNRAQCADYKYHLILKN